MPAPPIPRSTRTCRSAVLVFCLPLLVLCLAAPPATASSHPTRRQPDAALQAALDSAVASGVTGVEALVDDGSGLWDQASGVSQVSPRLAWRRDEKVRVGSVTKAFVA